MSDLQFVAQLSNCKSTLQFHFQTQNLQGQFSEIPIRNSDPVEKENDQEHYRVQDQTYDNATDRRSNNWRKENYRLMVAGWWKAHRL